jgi:hypothetical protein
MFLIPDFYNGNLLPKLHLIVNNFPAGSWAVQGTSYPPEEGLAGQGLGPAGEGFHCKWNSPAAIA